MIIPQKLKPGDEIRIIAPSCASATLPPVVIEKGIEELRRLGLVVTWGENTRIVDEFECAPIAARIADFHAAFKDANVKAILAVRGGFYANQLLDFIDWGLVKNNPKIFCGFSDITILQNALLAQVGLVSYSGPNLSYIGKSGVLEYTMDYFKRCLFFEGSIVVEPSKHYQDFGSLEGLRIQESPLWTVLSEGTAEGVCVGGNLCTVNLLQGTPYMPSLSGAILFLEDDAESTYRDFDRNLQSLIHLPDFERVRGLIIGRFQQESAITIPMLHHIVDIRPELQRIPVLANVDFGHTEPKITFPIGGTVRMSAQASGGVLEIVSH